MSFSPFILVVPGVIQGALILWDEIHFHRRRGLPAFERVGHPLDTASVLLCLGWLIFHAPGSDALGMYVLLAVASTLLVTKDEWIHARECSAAEHWLHSVLFTLHPVVLGASAWLWILAAEGRDGGIFGPAIGFQAALILVFWIYQVVYWNFSRRTEGSS